MFPGHGPRFPPVRCLLVYHLIVICSKESGWDITAGFCDLVRPNEQFSGKGHKIHECKRCKARPKSARQAIEDKDDFFGFLKQSHISAKNVARLEQMAKSDNPQVASLAAIVLDVARIKPYKTRRLKFLAHKHPELLGKLRDTGLILAHHR